MNKCRRQFGFSLLEALMATGILGMGLVLIAMVFPVGIKLTGISAERTIGAIAANEAFAKIQLHGLPEFSAWPVSNPAIFPHTECVPYKMLLELKYSPMTPLQWQDLQNEFLYPSITIPTGQEPHKYHWSALCRAVDAQQVQATVFVTRKAAGGLLYYTYTPTVGQNGSWPSPMPVNVSFDSTGAATDSLLRRQLRIESAPAFNQTINRTFLSDNVTIVANHNGRIYRVQEYIDKDNDNIKDTLVLTEDWQPSLTNPNNGTIWVVPPGVGSTRDPVIGVVQKTLLF